MNTQPNKAQQTNTNFKNVHWQGKKHMDIQKHMTAMKYNCMTYMEEHGNLTVAGGH
jgi:hypothetical protein